MSDWGTHLSLPNKQFNILIENDDFEIKPVLPQLVKESWSDEEEEEEVPKSTTSSAPSSAVPKKKKTLSQKIAEREEEKKRKEMESAKVCLSDYVSDDNLGRETRKNHLKRGRKGRCNK